MTSGSEGYHRCVSPSVRSKGPGLEWAGEDRAHCSHWWARSDPGPGDQFLHSVALEVSSAEMKHPVVFRHSLELWELGCSFSGLQAAATLLCQGPGSLGNHQGAELLGAKSDDEPSAGGLRTARLRRYLSVPGSLLRGLRLAWSPLLTCRDPCCDAGCSQALHLRQGHTAWKVS